MNAETFLRLRTLTLALTSILFILPATAQTRYKDVVFFDSTPTLNIQFGQNYNISSQMTPLLLNFFEPINDTEQKRPLVIWLHGGSFIGGGRSDMDEMCRQFAYRGYASATIDYRLGVISQNLVRYSEALLRAIQDTKAAIRFFHKNAATYRIDTTRIIVGGSSAGSIIAAHMAFLDMDELPAGVDTVAWGNLEGNSGTPGYPSDIIGAINYCGSIYDTLWIDSGELPCANFHGANDPIIPCYVGISSDFHIQMYGGGAISATATRFGIYAPAAIIAGMGHGVGESTTWADSLKRFSVNFAYKLVTDPVVKTEPDQRPIPERMTLEQNFPNPFNPSTVIPYSLTSEGFVTLSVYDVLGKKVASLVSTHKSAGEHYVRWIADDVQSGTYFCRLLVRDEAGNEVFRQTRRMLLVK